MLRSIISQNKMRAFVTTGILCASALGLAVAAIVVSVLSPQYLGSVRVKEIQGFEAFHASSPLPVMERFITTQSRIIKSTETLYPVIEELQLQERWHHTKNLSDTYSALVEMIEPEQERGTDFLDINVYHSHPQQAADLATAIASAYLKRRFDIEVARGKMALERLNDHLEQRNQQVDDARQLVIELGEHKNEEEPTTFRRHREAIRELQVQEIILSDMREAILAETVSLLNPDSPVVIHEAAVVNEMPVRPNKPLYLFFGALAGGLMFSVPAAIRIHGV